MWTVQLRRIVFTNPFIFLTASVTLFTVNDHVGFIDVGSISSIFLHASLPSPPPSSSPSTVLQVGSEHHHSDSASSSNTDLVTSEDELNYREQDQDSFFPSEASSPWLDISPVENEAGKDASQGDAIERTLMSSENSDENPRITLSSFLPPPTWPAHRPSAWTAIPTMSTTITLISPTSSRYQLRHSPVSTSHQERLPLSATTSTVDQQLSTISSCRHALLFLV